MKKSEHKKITGFNTPNELLIYQQGYNDHEQIMMEWIKKWNGNNRSQLGKLLNEKYKELYS